MLNKYNQILVKRASFLAVIVAGIIIIAKIFAYSITNSVSILASLVDSILDIAASTINVLAIYYSLLPPDEDHRFGHGKAEDLAVLTQSSFVGISGIFVIFTAIKRLIFHTPIEQGSIGIILMLFSIFVTLILILYQNYVIKKTNSKVIKADNFHYLIDLFTNFSIIIAIVLAFYFNIYFADAVFALFIVIYIMYGAWKLLRKSLDNLMDKELSDDEKQIIKDVIMSNPKISGFHDLKTRYSGTKPIIQFHLEMDGNMSLKQAHSITEAVEKSILEKMPHAEVIIHQDPEGIEEVVKYTD